MLPVWIYIVTFQSNFIYFLTFLSYISVIILEDKVLKLFYFIIGEIRQNLK